jgi:hypothetical protein
MRSGQTVPLAVVVLSLAALPMLAAKPAPSEKPPDAYVFGNPETESKYEGLYFWQDGDVHSRQISVPAGGAWIFGKVNPNSMECRREDRRAYDATLIPNGAGFSPFFTLEVTEWDTGCGFWWYCETCDVNFGGIDPWVYRELTTETRPAFLPEGSYTVEMRRRNVGVGWSVIGFWLAQVNQSSFGGGRLYEANSASDPTPYSGSTPRVYVSGSNDRVPVVPIFKHGNWEFPAASVQVYRAYWDGSTTPSFVEPQQVPPKALNGFATLLVQIPRMKSGAHDLVIEAEFLGGAKVRTSKLSVQTLETGLFVHASTLTSFNTKKPVDMLPQFIPGEDASNGAGVWLWDDEGRPKPQVVELHFRSPADGTIQLSLPSFSSFPGIAMNFPIAEPASDPDMDFGSLDPDTGKPKGVELNVKRGGWAMAPLYIRDYGARGLLKVTMPGVNGPYTYTVDIPLDDDRNGLPDAGWTALTLPDNSVPPKVDSSAITSASEDFDTNPAGPTRYGDGLSAYEEYRGFVVNGTHLRFHPFVRDLFVDVDEYVDTDMFKELPFLITYVGHEDTSNESIKRTTTPTLSPIATTGTLHRVRPVINPNRGAAVDDQEQSRIPGARPLGQRALRVIYQKDLPPTKVFPQADGTFRYYEIYYTGIAGVAFPETFKNFDVENAWCGDFPQPCNKVSYGSPNETVFVEVYPKLFENIGIKTSSFPNHTDKDGLPVQDCADVIAANGDPEITPCDDVISIFGRTLIAPRGRDGNAFRRLNTVLDLATHPTDFRSTSVLTFQYLDGFPNPCFAGSSYVLEKPEFERLPAIAAVHELMHGLTAPHSTSCTSVMFSAKFNNDDHTVLDIFRVDSNNAPIPLRIGDEDKGGLKLWVPVP